MLGVTNARYGGTTGRGSGRVRLGLACRRADRGTLSPLPRPAFSRGSAVLRGELLAGWPVAQLDDPGLKRNCDRVRRIAGTEASARPLEVHSDRLV